MPRIVLWCNDFLQKKIKWWYVWNIVKYEPMPIHQEIVCEWIELIKNVGFNHENSKKDAEKVDYLRIPVHLYTWSQIIPL